MTTLHVVYIVTVFVWFVLGGLGVYSNWSRGIDQKTVHIIVFIMLGIVPIVNTLLLLVFFFEEMIGSEIIGRKQ